MLKNLFKSLAAGRAVGRNERAIALWRRGDLDGAERMLRKVIAAQPSFVPAYSNLGMVLWQARQLEEGMALLTRAVELDTQYAGARVNLASALISINKTRAALVHFREALRIEPGNPQAHLNMLMPLLDTCDWDAVETQTDLLVSRWRAGGDDTLLDCLAPHLSLLVAIPPEFRLAIARHHAALTGARVARAPRVRRHDTHGDRRLRVGYVSSNFRNHPVAHLAAGLFEQHDRARFETFAYSIGHDDGSAYYRRIVAGFDHFTDIHALSHPAAAQCIARDGIDILVDLLGHTESNRLEIFALRPAPVQVTYLGYPGTTGADFIDYIVVDRTIVPPADARWCSEQPVWMPATYQVNDDRREIAPVQFTRAQAGLPDGFVFCGFNGHCKIERRLFESWLGILAGVPDSVLWLREGNGEERLRAHAAHLGIEPRRLIFAANLPPAENLARHRLVDLFLDTHTYNAHTTASDALWAGAPLITCPAPCFQGRVAASLLKAVGLPELIAPDLASYEERAIALARNPEALRTLREKLAANRLTHPLFDTRRFTRDLESAYTTMHERSRSGATAQPINAG